MTIALPDLPYADDALAPHISAETISYHYGKHHASYVAKLNGLIADTPLADKSLEEIVRESNGGIFNNAAQIWNHTFYWESLSPNGGGQPEGAIADAINRSFGNYETFRTAFTNAAATQFGSGWAWLVESAAGVLELRQTANAETPLTEEGVKPLLTIDVWEHAYYIDFRNARPQYIDTYLDHLVNWDAANSRLAAKTGS